MITAKLRHLRIAPRKARLVADLIRGKSASEARTILNFTVKKASLPILKLLNSAIANAKNNFQIDENNLYILAITVDAGPKIKRWRARARGSANTIEKKTSHINLALDEIKKVPSAQLRASKKISPLTPSINGETPGVAAPKEKPKPKPVAEIKKPVVTRVAQKIFRRKVF